MRPKRKELLIEEFSEPMAGLVKWWRRKYTEFHKEDAEIRGFILWQYLKWHAETAAEGETRTGFGMRKRKRVLNEDQLMPILACRKWVAPEHEADMEWAEMCRAKYAAKPTPYMPWSERCRREWAYYPGFYGITWPRIGMPPLMNY